MKKTMIAGGLTSATALALAALIGGSALAQQASPPQEPRHAPADTDGDGRVSQAEFVQTRIARLTALDTDHDGSVSADEFRAGMQARRAERTERQFDRLDADKNGEISRAEFEAARDHRAEHAGRGPGGGRHEGGMGPGRGMGHRMGPHMGPGMERGMGPHGPGQRMAEHGPIVIAEVQTRLTEEFARLDTNHDGYLTQDERAAAWAAMREQRHDRMAERWADRGGDRGDTPAPSLPARPSE